MQTRKPRVRSAIFAGVVLAGYAWSPAAFAQPCDEFARFTSPNAGADANFLLGVAALSADEAWAVGHYRAGSTAQPLSMRWDGANWVLVAMPAPPSSGGAPQVTLYDAHAFSSDDVWAVGSNPPPSSTALETLAYRWDGSTWNIVPSPAGCCGAFGSAFYCVDGVSGDDFWAVGYLNEEGPNAYPLAAHWNGAGWEEHRLPGLGNARVQSIRDLHVLAADDIWALEATGINVPTQPHRIFHWDGSSWSEGTSPINTIRYGSGTEAIFAFGPDDIWVSTVVQLTYQVVMLHWNGSTWTEMNVPVFAYEFFGSAPDDLYAVGSTSIMHWDGAEWTIVAVLPDAAAGNLFDSEISPDGTLWSAGATEPGAASQTLIGSYKVCEPSSPGDTDGDGDVDLSDLGVVLAAYGLCEGDAGYAAAADFDANACIDLSDLGIVLANFGT